MDTLPIIVLANLLVLAALVHWLASTDSQDEAHKRR
jgi:hypothetical protein